MLARRLHFSAAHGREHARCRGPIAGVPSHDGRNSLSQLTFIAQSGVASRRAPRQGPAPASAKRGRPVTAVSGFGWARALPGARRSREGLARGGPDPDRLARPPSPRTRPRHVSPVLRERRRRHRPGEDPDRRPRHDEARRRRSGRLHPRVVDAGPPRGEPGRRRRLRHERRVDHRQHRLRPGRLRRRRPRRLRRVLEGRARRLRSRGRQQRQHHLRSHRRGGRRVAPRGGHAARLRRPAARVRRRSPRRGRPRQPRQRQLPRWPADGVPRLRPVPRHRRREARRRTRPTRPTAGGSTRSGCPRSCGTRGADSPGRRAPSPRTPAPPPSTTSTRGPATSVGDASGGNSHGTRMYGGSPAGPEWSSEAAPLDSARRAALEEVISGAGRAVAIANAGDRLFVVDANGRILAYQVTPEGDVQPPERRLPGHPGPSPRRRRARAPRARLPSEPRQQRLLLRLLHGEGERQPRPQGRRHRDRALPRRPGRLQHASSRTPSASS